MHMGKLPAAEEPGAKLYQGVRVKDPVKELLRRKRGHSTSGVKPAPPTAVVTPNGSLLSYSHTGNFGPAVSSQCSPTEPAVDLGTICTGWIAQPSPTALQPMSQWSGPDYLHPDPPQPPFSSDMYVQPVCPSYTVVGPSSMLTLTHTPLFTNFGTLTPSTSSLPQVDLPDSLTYIPWAQPLTTFSSPVMQCPPYTPTLPGPQLLPVPVPVPVVAASPPQEETSQAQDGTLALEKLLEDQEPGGDPKDSYICDSSIFGQDI